jgi:hypothetical protein
MYNAARESRACTKNGERRHRAEAFIEGACRKEQSSTFRWCWRTSCRAHSVRAIEGILSELLPPSVRRRFDVSSPGVSTTAPFSCTTKLCTVDGHSQSRCRSAQGEQTGRSPLHFVFRRRLLCIRYNWIYSQDDMEQRGLCGHTMNDKPARHGQPRS